jgi:hypothetical protein
LGANVLLDEIKEGADTIANLNRKPVRSVNPRT